MILPIYAYGQSVLRQKAQQITKEYAQLELLVQNMFETMYNARGVGLAAPQVGLSIRIFVMDSTAIENRNEKRGETRSTDSDAEKSENDNQNPLPGIKKIFINPEKISESGPPFKYEEGCLSIPDITNEVTRPSNITLRYWDENFNETTEEFTGIRARIIQHEYDHLEGILFTDYVSPLKRHLISGKLQRIAKGNIESDYPMFFAKNKKGAR
jgi:peptide deformylase